jgi:hypothetical protein
MKLQAIDDHYRIPCFPGAAGSRREPERGRDNHGQLRHVNQSKCELHPL